MNNPLDFTGRTSSFPHYYFVRVHQVLGIVSGLLAVFVVSYYAKKEFDVILANEMQKVNGVRLGLHASHGNDVDEGEELQHFG
mmetsp:Transcript_19254/g.39031  ORF Transcript_19254/g.39031 Transcript_19254/m.39031 type:complete len:83 (-) Transcript_19254:7-255(-)